ncbi:MAG: potassium channel family protein [Candidatus Acidiferrales bacterium]
MILTGIVGFLIVALVLWEAFETIVLPRRVTRRFRLTVLFYRGTWLFWRGVARRIRNKKSRDLLLGIYGPLSLLCLFVLWATGLILGFGIMYFAASRHELHVPSLGTCFYMSGTNFFTLGLGDVQPHNSIERVLAVVESGLGFGFLALVLSYLPVIYQAFSRREVNIVLLDARAGSPPSAAELLRRHSGPGGHDALQVLLHEWERWSAELLESHISYPVVSYFRSQHANESWLAALTPILDTSALLISGAESACSRQARLTFAMCRHTVVDLAQVFYAAPRATSHDRLPHADLSRLRKSLATIGWLLADTPAADEKLTKLRDMYEPYVVALGRHLAFELPPWILAKEVADNWKTSAWGRITGYSANPAPESEPAIDDHSD